jgi:hypothetical protein
LCPNTEKSGVLPGAEAAALVALAVDEVVIESGTLLVRDNKSPPDMVATVRDLCGPRMLSSCCRADVDRDRVLTVELSDTVRVAILDGDSNDPVADKVSVTPRPPSSESVEEEDMSLSVGDGDGEVDGDGDGSTTDCVSDELNQSEEIGAGAWDGSCCSDG